MIFASKNTAIQDWGLTQYDNAFARQRELVHQRIENEIPDTLVFTEHAPVYTLGTRKGTHDHLLWQEKRLQVEGISLAKTNRGGDITYHGPGQVVGYPIISLADSKDLHVYLRNLEQVLINALGCLGLSTGRRKGKTGIWFKDQKIAAIGIAVKRWVTYHGFALNVNNDLAHFQGIVPCGISSEDGSVTSLEQELGTKLDLSEVKNIIAVEFWNLFSNH